MSTVTHHLWRSLEREYSSWRELDWARESIWSIHLVLGLPGFLFPSTCLCMMTFSTQSPSVLAIWPKQLNIWLWMRHKRHVFSPFEVVNFKCYTQKLNACSFCPHIMGCLFRDGESWVIHCKSTSSKQKVKTRNHDEICINFCQNKPMSYLQCYTSTLQNK